MITYEEIEEGTVSFMVFMSGKSPKKVAETMGISERTFYRKLSKDFVGNKLPILMACGNLGAIDEAWKGWRLSQGKLMTPSGYSVLPTQIEGMQWIKELSFDYLGRKIRDPYMLNFRVSGNDEGTIKPSLRLIKSGLAGGDHLRAVDGTRPKAPKSC